MLQRDLLLQHGHTQAQERRIDNPYTRSAVAAMENQIHAAQQEWIWHQEDRFTAQLSLNQEELQSSRPQTAQSSLSVPLASASNNHLVLEQLDQIEQLIRR